MLTCLGQILWARKSRRDESQHESTEHPRITHTGQGGFVMSERSLQQAITCRHHSYQIVRQLLVVKVALVDSMYPECKHLWY